MERPIEGGDDVLARFTRHEIVSMFGVNENFNVGSIAGEIDGNVNRRDSIEVSQQLFSLVLNVFVRTGTQCTMSAGDSDLHRNLLFLCNDSVERMARRIPKQSDHRSPLTTPIETRPLSRLLYAQLEPTV